MGRVIWMTARHDVSTTGRNDADRHTLHLAVLASTFVRWVNVGALEIQFERENGTLALSCKGRLLGVWIWQQQRFCWVPSGYRQFSFSCMTPGEANSFVVGLLHQRVAMELLQEYADHV